MPSGALRTAQGHAETAISRQNGGNPPAPTFAAQIVETFTQAQYPARQPDKEEFQRLLQEILNPEDDGDDFAESIETNVDVNCRLIYVVVRAGLEPFLNRDSSRNQDEFHKQAIASLSVVELTVRRSPGVLFSAFHSPNHLVPLYLWLLPRLFIILGSTKDEDTRRCVFEALKTAILAEKASYRQNKFLLVQKYLQGCVKGERVQTTDR